MGARSNGIIFADLKWPITRVSRSPCKIWLPAPLKFARWSQ